MSVNKSNRIFYFDALRALAIFCVICIHIYAEIQKGVMPDYGLIPSYKWFYAQFMGNCLRIGVPLFLMISGALLLGRKESVKEFLSKRIPRIVVPFLFWGLILTMLLVLLSYFTDLTYIRTFDAFHILRLLFRDYIAQGRSFAPYWFFWTILGLYLIMPIINKWLDNSKLNEAEYFLVIWLIACLFIYTFKIDLPINLTYFVGPIGYIVLGYYLRHTERKILNNPYFDIFLILISAVSMIFFSWYFSSTETVYNFDIYTILVIGEATGVFLLFKNFYKFNLKLNFIRNPHSIVNKLIMAMAKYSYGIYLTHATIIVIFVDAIDGFGFHVNGFTISMLVIALFVTLAIMFILDKIPVINQLIGSK